MTDSPITLGDADGASLNLDLDQLIGAHLGIVANSGGGKSGLIRKILETTHGHIQHIALDKLNCSPAREANAGGSHEVAQPKSTKPEGARVSSQSNAPSGSVPASQQRVLDAIAWWEAIGIKPVARHRASVIAGLSPKASTFGVYVSKLAQAGLVDTSTPGSVALTDAGRAAANNPGKINRRDVVLQARAMLKPAAANVFDEIVARYPNWIERGDLADIVGLSRTASTLGVYISESSKLGFVETRPGVVRAAEWMMP